MGKKGEMFVSLREKLKGVYDLDNLADCQAVLGVMASDVNECKKRESMLRDKLKSLSLKVLNGNPDMKRMAKSIVAKDSGGQDVMKFLSQMADEMDGAKKLKDSELVLDVLDKVWSDYDINTRESALVGEIVDRFRIAKKIKKEKR